MLCWRFSVQPRARSCWLWLHDAARCFRAAHTYNDSRSEQRAQEHSFIWREVCRARACGFV
jgi:hypothetical protein